jgi:hypothetical protein
VSSVATNKYLKKIATDYTEAQKNALCKC